jgi:hypothetical protein
MACPYTSNARNPHKKDSESKPGGKTFISGISSQTDLCAHPYNLSTDSPLERKSTSMDTSSPSSASARLPFMQIFSLSRPSNGWRVFQGSRGRNGPRTSCSGGEATLGYSTQKIPHGNKVNESVLSTLHHIALRESSMSCFLPRIPARKLSCHKPCFPFQAPR